LIITISHSVELFWLLSDLFSSKTDSLPSTIEGLDTIRRRWWWWNYYY